MAERLAEETTLSEREAEVVALRIEGVSFPAIGERLDVEGGTAHKHWQRAKRKAADAKQSAEMFAEIGLVE